MGKLCREKRPINLERNNNWIIRHGDFTPRNSGPQDRADARWIGEEDRKGTTASISDWQWCFFLLDPFVIYVTLLHMIFDGNSGNSVVLEHEER